MESVESAGRGSAGMDSRGACGVCVGVGCVVDEVAVDEVEVEEVCEACVDEC